MCARCNRILLRPPVVLGGMCFGPKCAAAVLSMRRPETRQQDLFKEVRP